MNISDNTTIPLKKNNNLDSLQAEIQKMKSAKDYLKLTLI